MGMALGLSSIYTPSCGTKPAGENEPCTPESGCSYGRECVEEVCVEKTYTCEDLAYNYVHGTCAASPEERAEALQEALDPNLDYDQLIADDPANADTYRCFEDCCSNNPVEQCFLECAESRLLNYCLREQQKGEFSTEVIQNNIECCSDQCH